MKERTGFGDHCYRTWAERNQGEPPPWAKEDYIALATVEHRLKDREKAEAAWGRFLDSDDKFHAGHDPRTFLRTLSVWTERRSSGPAVAPKVARTRAALDEYLQRERRDG